MSESTGFNNPPESDPDVDPAGSVGQVIGPIDDPDRYEIVGKPLRGGEGYTYKVCAQTAGGRQIFYAVKQIRKRSSALLWPTDAQMRRWRHQIDVLNSSNNDHIVRVLDLFKGEFPHDRGKRPPQLSDTTRPYFVMEWVDGESVSDILKRRSLTSAELARFIKELAEAIESLHSSQLTPDPMLHGDIKPQNCIIHPTKGLILVDTGSLTPLAGQTGDSAAMTRNFAAPEVLARAFGQSPIDLTPSSDYYSIGALLFFCIASKEVGDAGDPSNGSLKLILRPFCRANQVSIREFAPLLYSILDKDPSARPTSITAWAASVSAAIWTRPLVRRNRRKLMRLTIALILLIAPLNGASLETQNPDRPLPNFTPFGLSYAPFQAIQSEDALLISPPTGLVSFDHNWGVRNDQNACSSIVEFDVTLDDTNRENGFGVGVAPRSELFEDQAWGDSVQYEWLPEYVNGTAESRIRRSYLPDESFNAATPATPAPDVGSTRHIRVVAAGRTMTISVDETTATYTTDSVECGGVAIRAWGSPVSIANLRIPRR